MYGWSSSSVDERKPWFAIPVLVLLAMGRFRCVIDLVVTPRGGGVVVGLKDGL